MELKNNPHELLEEQYKIRVEKIGLVLNLECDVKFTCCS